ncbi:hypothetical protein J6590_092715 [Homalodisca vitripennis]|nr:hypothetical protein J6590_092715 [Homalodisca vitripennis]
MVFRRSRVSLSLTWYCLKAGSLWLIGESDGGGIRLMTDRLTHPLYRPAVTKTGLRAAGVTSAGDLRFATAAHSRLLTVQSLLSSFEFVGYKMPGKRCTVAVCNNSHAKTKEKGVVYFNFPKDPEIRSRWVYLCKRAGKWNPDSCSVCSDHFLLEDYERDLKSELLNLPRKKKLKQSVVPSQKLTNTPVCENVKTGNELTLNRKKRYTNRNNKQLVHSLVCPEKSETFSSEELEAECSELTTSTLLPNLET